MPSLKIDQLRVRHIGPIDIRIGPDELVTVSGPSGAGKTLLLRAVADLDLHRGRVFLDEVEAGRMDAPDWRRQVGFLPAESHWWCDTVGAHFHGGIEPFVPWWHALGFDLDVLGWKIRRLSTGERQRLALLRLLTNRPRALLLDEPTANLDEENERAAEGLLADYARENASPVFWVSHNQRQIRRMASRHFRLKNGILREDGSPWA